LSTDNCVTNIRRCRLALVCVVLDEFPQILAAPRRDHIHGVFKRPQFRQCRDGLVRAIARTPPPAFLFPNQRCQRPRPGDPTPPVLRRAAGGGGYLVAGLRQVNRVLPDLSAARRKPAGFPKLGAKTAPGCGGATLVSRWRFDWSSGKYPSRGEKQGEIHPLSAPAGEAPARAGAAI